MRFVIFVFVFVLLFSNRSLAQTNERINILFMIADDWSFGHAGIYGDRVVKTPNIDAIGREGAVFMNAFTAAPSCTPSRAAILTGRFPHELEAGASLWGYLPTKFDTYTRILSEAGYYVGLAGKGWAPGNFRAGGYEQNPAGKSYKDFKSFLDELPDGAPFCFWYGSGEPHRPYTLGAGAAAGMKAHEVAVPAWLPDATEVRNDILDYYEEVQRFDSQIGEIISLLKARGAFEKTLIVITSDNGMPFPRAKATLYDSGTKMPLLMALKGRIEPKRIHEFVSLTDLAPTFLELAGEKVPEAMTGSSLWPLLRGEKVSGRKQVFTERERHANVRKPELGYPARAIRTEDFLYIRNYKPERWPAGDPEVYHSVGPYGDIDNSPTKEYIIQNRRDATVAPFFARGFEKRPADELYDLKSDPDQLKNVAADKRYRKILAQLKKQLDDWQVATGDPRATGSGVDFDTYPYFGGSVKGAPSTYKPPQQFNR